MSWVCLNIGHPQLKKRERKFCLPFVHLPVKSPNFEITHTVMTACVRLEFPV